MSTALDDRDKAILDARQDALDAKTGGPHEGDFVRFADGAVRRVSYVWRDEHGEILPGGVQTSDGGSFHLAMGGHVSFSGGLYPGVDAGAMTLTAIREAGRVWFFHHNLAGAGRGVDAFALFPVWKCSLEANR